MRESTIIGIDMGLNGAITVFRGGTIRTMEMPLIKDVIDYHRYFQILGEYRGEDVHVCFEKLGVIFGSSKKTTFSMGYQAGATEMLCIGLGYRYTMVQPKKWQAVMFNGIDELTIQGTTRRDTKAMALVAVKRLFPSVNLTFGPRAVKPHDGLIDSLLIAEYCKRTLT